MKYDSQGRPVLASDWNALQDIPSILSSFGTLGAPGVGNFTLTYNGSLAWSTTLAGANPSASAGLAAVNGTATTFMRSDGAPAISQAIVPTWTGAHTFTASETRIANSSGFLSVYNTANSARSGFLQFNAAALSVLQVDVNQALSIRTDATERINIAAGGAVVVAGEMAINGGTPSAALSGFGSPSGSVTSGLTSSATLAQTAGTLAALLAYLKTIGFIAT